MIIKALSDQRILDICTPVIYGSSRILGYYKKITEIENFPANLINSAKEAHPRRINVVNCIPDSIPEPGKQNEEGGRGAKGLLKRLSKNLKTDFWMPW